LIRARSSWPTTRGPEARRIDPALTRSDGNGQIGRSYELAEDQGDRDPVDVLGPSNQGQERHHVDGLGQHQADADAPVLRQPLVDPGDVQGSGEIGESGEQHDPEHDGGLAEQQGAQIGD
jgi:hypothetical protein